MGKFRSGFEESISIDLKLRGIKHDYENTKFKYTKDICKHCGHVTRLGTYTPDFRISRTSGLCFFVEAKGRFTGSDRNKIKRVIRDNTGIDLRLLFQRDLPIVKGSRKLYSDWCRLNNIECHVGNRIPERWLK